MKLFIYLILFSFYYKLIKSNFLEIKSNITDTYTLKSSLVTTFTIIHYIDII